MARSVVLALALAGLNGAALAQSPDRAPSLRELPFDSTPRAPRAEPGGRSDDAAKGRKAEAPPPTTLESLYDRLARAKDGPEASAIVKQIERRWMRSGSETADLLLVRAGQAAAAKDNETALELFDFMIMLRPQWAEAYHRRATLLFSMNDHDGALRDIQATLTRDPRHFSALAGLGMIMQQVDNKKAAYRAFTRALELNPHMTNLKEMVEKLKPEIEGQPL